MRRRLAGVLCGWAARLDSDVGTVGWEIQMSENGRMVWWSGPPYGGRSATVARARCLHLPNYRKLVVRNVTTGEVALDLEGDPNLY